MPFGGLCRLEMSSQFLNAARWSSPQNLERAFNDGQSTSVSLKPRAAQSFARRHRAGSLDHTGREWCRLNLGRKGRVLRLERGIEPIEQVWIEHRYELGDRAIKRGGHVLDLGIID